jgi:hypothetical protein
MNNEPVSYVTALDLADIMQDYAEAGFQYPLCMELKYVAVMLRQQQAEIEALKLQLHTTLTNRNLEKPAKYSDAWWKEVAEFNKARKAQK